MQKKGQAAMEFLMTYGWAILAAVIAIGVLAYFGVFSPGRYIPETCVLTAPLSCEEHQIISETGATDDGSVRLIIRNGAGDDITISSIDVQDCITGATGGDVDDGGTLDTTITCNTDPGMSLTSGGRFKGDIAITYTKSTATIPQTSTGSVGGKAV